MPAFLSSVWSGSARFGPVWLVQLAVQPVCARFSSAPLIRGTYVFCRMPRSNIGRSLRWSAWIQSWIRSNSSLTVVLLRCLPDAAAVGEIASAPLLRAPGSSRRQWLKKKGQLPPPRQGEGGRRCKVGDGGLKGGARPLTTR